MKTIKYLILFLAYLFLGLSSVFAEINVGIPFFYPPYVITTSQGFDVEYIEAICERLKEQCNLLPMDFSLFFDSLTSGKIDLAIGGITISSYPGYIFSLPYKISRGRFLITNASNASSAKDLGGKTVGILMGEALSGAFYRMRSAKYTYDPHSK